MSSDNDSISNFITITFCLCLLFIVGTVCAIVLHAFGLI